MIMMRDDTEVLIAIGSNFNQRFSMAFAKKQLHGIFYGSIKFSDEVWTEPVGMKSDMFLNCLCAGRTIHKKGQLEKALKRVERQCLRCKKYDQLNRITLDIDILQYGELRFHEQDWQREYIHDLLRKKDEWKYLHDIKGFDKL